MNPRPRSESAARAISGAVLLVLWSGPVAASLWIPAPFGATEARSLVAELFAPSSARYLGFCPMPLVVYFFAAMLVRHPVALALAAAARFGRAGAPQGRLEVATSILRSCITWALFAGSGAFAASLLSGQSAEAKAWSLEVAWISALAGLPCVTAASVIALLVRSTALFWLLSPFVLTVLAIFSFGLTGGRVAALLPGAIELALTSGVESMRHQAILGAAAWPALGAVLAVWPRRSASNTRSEVARVRGR